MTYEYRFEEVDVRKNSKAYQDAIATHAANGWRFVQAHIEMPAAVQTSVILIFEREQEKAGG